MGEKGFKRKLAAILNADAKCYSSLAYDPEELMTHRDRCKTALYFRFLRQAQISILEIFYIFLWLKFSHSLNSNINYHFSKVSLNLTTYRFSMTGLAQQYRFNKFCWAVGSDKLLR